MDKTYLALLFDTQSIQKYIFSGNKLKTNIGASYIVEEVFSTILPQILRSLFPDDKFEEFDAWDIEQDNRDIFEFNECSIAYIGGGNALLLFQPEKEDRCREVVENFTRELLIKRPGLRVGVAYGTMNPSTMKEDMNKLHRELKNNQGKILPRTNIHYTGLTLTCDVNGEAANAIVKGQNGLRFISQETAVKEDMSQKANEKLIAKFSSILKMKYNCSLDDYTFPTQLDKLGQKQGEQYIGVVHVDANNMGRKISDINSLEDLRKVSREIARKNEGAFAELLYRIICADKKNLFGDILEKYEENQKRILPIRPLIIGGDDVTFACPANMAVLYTKFLLETLAKTTPENAVERVSSNVAKTLDACGGIIIVSDTYPFARAYSLAEEVCSSAKKAMRNSNTNSSWLDFLVLHGNEGTLDGILKNEYSSARSEVPGILHFGPYRVANEGATNIADRRHNIEPLLECVEKLNNEEQEPKTPPRNKLKALRNVLQNSEDEAARFLTRLKNQGKEFPIVKDWENFVGEDLWTKGNDRRTPYTDVLEILEFWPMKKEVIKEWNLISQ